MKWLCKTVFLCLSLTPNPLTPSAPRPPRVTPEASYRGARIKVLLGEFDPTKKQLFNIQSKQEFVLKSKSKKFLLRSNKLQILLKNKILYGRGKKGPFKKIDHSSIEIKPKSTKTIHINKKPYHGTLTFKFCPKTKKLLLINTLDLEDYVYAVLLAESYQSWPHEMQKIQAIVSRTYAVHQMTNRHHNRTRPYNIKCNNFHQRYTGKHDYKHLRQAVDETKNLILTHDNKVVLAMFDACCGGSIPANMTGIDFSKAPYLARKTACHFCKEYKLYHWKRNFTQKHFLAHLHAYSPLANKFKNIRKLTDITITERDQAGVVHTVQLTSPQGTVTVPGADLWRSMNNHLRSQNFSVTCKNKNIVVEGHGFGHQIGLCQRGARELVKRGWPLKKILEFYYPNTNLAKLKVVKHANV